MKGREERGRNMYIEERKREEGVKKRSHLILRNCSMSVVKPPHTRTVPITITSVVVNMSCLA